MSTVRGRGSSMSKIRASRPGRGVITTTRSARKIASPMLCVTKTIVLRVSDHRAHQQEVHLVAGERVERAEGLVHQHHSGSGSESADDRGALLHAARQLARVGALEAGQPHLLEQHRDALLVDGSLLDLERELDVLAQVAPGQEVRVLEHHPDLRGSRPDDGAAVDQDLTAGQGMQPCHRPEQRRLPAAARPENADELAGCDVEREVVRARGRGRSSPRRSSSHRGSRSLPSRWLSSKPPLLVGVRVLHELDHGSVDDRRTRP